MLLQVTIQRIWNASVQLGLQEVAVYTIRELHVLRVTCTAAMD